MTRHIILQACAAANDRQQRRSVNRTLGYCFAICAAMAVMWTAVTIGAAKQAAWEIENQETIQWTLR